MNKTNTSNLKKVLATTALAGAGIGSADAAVVITLTGNSLSSTTNALNLDVTGDGIDDLAILSTNYGATSVLASFDIGGAFAGFSGGSYFAGVESNNQYTSSLVSITDSVAFTFTDANINGGALTSATLEITARNISSTSHEITLNTVTYDAVPEPSSIALLALGAGGLATRRRRSAA